MNIFLKIFFISVHCAHTTRQHKSIETGEREVVIIVYHKGYWIGLEFRVHFYYPPRRQLIVRTVQYTTYRLI